MYDKRSNREFDDDSVHTRDRNSYKIVRSVHVFTSCPVLAFL